MGAISGCMLDSNNHVVLYGSTDGRPYIVRGDPANKMATQEYLTLEPVVDPDDEDAIPKEFLMF